MPDIAVAIIGPNGMFGRVEANDQPGKHQLTFDRAQVGPHETFLARPIAAGIYALIAKDAKRALNGPPEPWASLGTSYSTRPDTAIGPHEQWTLTDEPVGVGSLSRAYVEHQEAGRPYIPNVIVIQRLA